MFGWFIREKLDTLWLYIALALFAVMLAVNGVAGSTSLLGGVQTAEVSDMYANLFTPAGFTFGIWGVIYLLLAAFFLRVFKLVRLRKPYVKNNVMNQVMVWFSLTSVLNTAWLLMWHYQLLTLSVAVMIGLLISLTKIHTLLQNQKMSPREYMLVRLPFSVYLGWISVATIANITAWLVGTQWDGFGISDVTWSIIVLIAGAAIAVVKGSMWRNPAYMTVFIWAYIGILYKHLSETGFDGEYKGVIVTLAVLLAVLIAATVQLIRERATTK